MGSFTKPLKHLLAEADGFILSAKDPIEKSASIATPDVLAELDKAASITHLEKMASDLNRALVQSYLDGTKAVSKSGPDFIKEAAEKTRFLLDLTSASGAELLPDFVGAP